MKSLIISQGQPSEARGPLLQLHIDLKMSLVLRKLAKGSIHYFPAVITQNCTHPWSHCQQHGVFALFRQRLNFEVCMLKFWTPYCWLNESNTLRCGHSPKNIKSTHGSCSIIRLIWEISDHRPAQRGDSFKRQEG